MDNCLVIEDIAKYYPGVKALEGVGFSVRKGEIHALVGENGAGKSTLIKILCGVLKPDHGTVYIDGKVCSFNHPLEAMDHGIAVTHQELGIFPNLSVAENISISRNIEMKRGLIHKKKMRDLARQTLEQLGIELDVNSPLKNLSIGMQNIVAIARCLVNSAKILILDEPTASLSKEEVQSLFRIINMLKDNGLSILFVSHKLDEVFAISQRTTVLRDGKYVKTFDTDTLTEEELVLAMVGRNILYERYPQRTGTAGILSVTRLCKKRNFQDITFTLKKGEILGFTGLVGAGRTEVAKSIFGCNPPDSGTVTLHGNPLQLTSTESSVKAGIAYLPESRHTHGLFLSKPLADNVASVILDRIVKKFNLIDSLQKNTLTEEWIQKLGITPPFPAMPIDQFSGGNQQKAVIAKWLAYQPKVLIVDEPTHGVDIGAKSEIHRLLRDLSSQGIGVMIISSELPEILAICDRIIVMRLGRIVGEFTSSEANQENIMNLALKG